MSEHPAIEQIERALAVLSRQPGMGTFGDGGPLARGEQLDRGAYVLLTRIEDAGPLSIREIADAFGLDDSTVNRKTASCVRDGILERIDDPDGGAARKFRLTEQGRARLDAHRRWARNGLSGVLEAWADEDLAALARSLDRLNQAIDARRAAVRATSS